MLRPASLLSLCIVACTTRLLLGQQAWTRSCSSSTTASEALEGIDLSGKVFVVTGSDGNIATEVNKALALANATLVLTCRKAEKCEAVKATIEKATGGKVGHLEIGLLDLSSKSSIQSFAQDMSTRHFQGIDGLVNSAGTFSNHMTKEGYVLSMSVNLLGPALLTELMSPLLRGTDNGKRRPGRVVNVAAAVWGTKLAASTTVDDLAKICTSLDAKLNSTGKYFQVSKYLMIHHALELAKREPKIASFAVNPGVGVEFATQFGVLPQWMLRIPLPSWLRKYLGIPSDYHKVCLTNEKGLSSCPETYAQSAAVIATAVAAPEIDSHSGSYLDFETKMLPEDAPQVYGPWTQKDPTCVPREPPPMDKDLQAAWFDKMLQMMREDSSNQIIA